MLHIHIGTATIAHVSLWRIGLRQFERHVITLLGCDEFVDSFHLRGIYKGTLHTDGLCSAEVKHITFTDQLLGTSTVQNGLRVNTSRNLERDSRREVGLDITRNNRCRRTLGGNHHVDTHGTGQLGNTGYRQFDFLAGSHDQITELIDDHHDIRHETVTSTWRNLAVDELLVILLDVTGTHFLQQVVAGIHQFTERVQGAYHLRHIRNNRIGIIVGHFGQEVVDQRIIDGELHLLRVHKYDLQFCRMLLI